MVFTHNNYSLLVLLLYYSWLNEYHLLDCVCVYYNRCMFVLSLNSGNCIFSSLYQITTRSHVVIALALVFAKK